MHAATRCMKCSLDAVHSIIAGIQQYCTRGAHLILYIIQGCCRHTTILYTRCSLDSLYNTRLLQAYDNTVHKVLN